MENRSGRSADRFNVHMRSVLAAGLVTAVFATPAMAKVISPFQVAPPSFQLQGRPLGGATPAAATAPFLTSSRIAALADGALVIDADSGNLIRTDRSGKAIAKLAIGGNAGLLAYDPIGKLAYVADRAGNRVAVVEVGETTLGVKRSLATPVEPYGVALSPDRSTVMVTTIADRALVAFDTATGKERWRTALGREPRGLAVSPDGTRALVAYLATGTVDQIDLLETHAAEHVALSTAGARPQTGAGATFARGSFAVTFMGEHEAVVPFQRETPVQANEGMERTGSYGGGFEPPVTHQLAFLGFDKGGTKQAVATIAQHQPRALAWDGAHDALYVAGMGTDTLLQIKNASQISVTVGTTANLRSGEACGPDGVAIAGDGSVLVWCSFTRSVERVDFAAAAKVASGPAVAPSVLSDKQHQGLVMFHTASRQVSQNGSMACASCHPDGRADGLSWRIEKRELQTPVLDGRLAGVHPFKWDGTDATLKDSMTSTMKRLGGTGLDKDQTDALASYLEALPAPRTPSEDKTMVARGKQLFESAELGCASCHDGKSYTDGERHKLASATLPEAKTPSLVGLAASAPYFHDGSAVTIEALLRDRGAVHGMAESAKLSDQQVADLTAYLQSL